MTKTKNIIIPDGRYYLEPSLVCPCVCVVVFGFVVSLVHQQNLCPIPLIHPENSARE